MPAAHTLSSRPLIATAALFAALATARAQPLPAVPPQDVLHLAAAGAVDVQQDLLTMRLATSRDGPDPAALQNQLSAAVAAALAQLKPAAAPGQLDVRTGRFGLSPRWNRDGRIDGWTGTAEVVLEGRDLARVTQAASKVQTLTVRDVAFGLSREERERAEREAQAAAIQRFRARAGELAKGFGFSTYTLREVTVSDADQGIVPVRMMAPAAASSVAPVPVEPGRTTVRVTVSGSVQLR